MEMKEKIEKIKNLLSKKGLKNKDIQEGYMLLSEVDSQLEGMIKHSHRISRFLDFLPMIENTKTINTYTIGNLSYKIKEALDPKKFYNLMNLMESEHEKNPMVLFENIKPVDAEKFDHIFELDQYIEDFFKNKKKYLFQKVFGYDIKTLAGAKKRCDDVYIDNDTIHIVAKSNKEEVQIDSYSFLDYGWVDKMDEICIRNNTETWYWKKIDKNAETSSMGFLDKTAQMEFRKNRPEYFI